MLAVPPTAYRVLIIDDNPTIHEDIKKILCPRVEDPAIRELSETLFGAQPPPTPNLPFQIDSAYQGQEGLTKVEQAIAENRPYTLAFVDIRMPPGWDGIETIRQIWRQYPELQVVVCTAYSDHSWESIVAQLGDSDSLIILKKPFDNVEVLQLAHALTKKWMLARENRCRIEDLDELVRTRTAALAETHARLQSEVQQRASVETALRAAETQFHQTLQSTALPAFTLHRQRGYCVEANDSFVAFAGRPRQEILGHTPDEWQLPVNPAEFQNILQQVDAPPPVRDLPCQLRRADGQVRDMLISVAPVRASGEDCVLLALQDVTEKHPHDSASRPPEKTDGLGRLAAGMAHDFNNLLTVIQCHTSLQLTRENLDLELVDSLHEVKAAADRAAALTKQLLAYSRRQIIKLKPLDLAPIIDRALELFQPTLAESVLLAREISPSLPAIFADEACVEQLLSNLLANARDAIAAGGKITVAATPVTFTPADAATHPDARLGSFVCLRVADTGCGIVDSVLPHIFDPFFTTKPKGSGLGLGLATVHGIIKQHEGWIEVHTQPGAGAVFSVFLPTSATPVTHPVTPTSPAAPIKTAPTAATILVVEDEASFRSLLAAGLTKRGYHVLQAADGVQARHIWQSASQPVDLLVTDLVMPHGVSGLALARRLRAESAQLRVLYISGYSPDLIDHSEHFEVGVNFLPKPFNAPQLIAAVERCLQAPPPPLPAHP